MIRLTVALSLFVFPAFGQSLFDSTAAAEIHCPGDVIVWLNSSRHIYRLPGQKGYGRAKASSYACKKEADAAGDKPKKVKPAPNTSEKADPSA
jgi:hypothetical protein